MGIAQKESRHAEMLRGMGFSQVDKELSLDVRQLTSRTERRILRKKKYRPWFTKGYLQTVATDETGQTWTLNKIIDLTAYGFEDKTEVSSAIIKTAETIGRKFRNMNPRFH